MQRETKEQERYDNVQYSQLFSLDHGGIYHYFKKRVLKLTIRNIFLGYVILMLIILISTSIRTQEILQNIEEQQTYNLAYINSQIQDNLSQQFNSIYLRLNYTGVIYQNQITQLNPLVLDQSCNLQKQGSVTDNTSNCIKPFILPNIESALANPSSNQLLFYKYNTNSYSQLSAQQQASIQNIIQFIDLQRAVFKSIIDNDYPNKEGLVYFFYLPQDQMFIFDSLGMNSASIKFAQLLSNYQNCIRYEQCLIDVDEEECQTYKQDCEYYAKCNQNNSGGQQSPGYDLNCILEEQIHNYPYQIYNTKLQTLNNYLHVCLSIIQNKLSFCSRINLFGLLDQLFVFDDNRFSFILTDQNFNIIYNNFDNVNFFKNETFQDKILQLGKQNADSNYSPSTIISQLSQLVNGQSQINGNVTTNQMIINIDSSQSYDSIKILMSMDVLNLQLTYAESIQTNPITQNYGVFMMTSADKFQEQKDFFDIFSYYYFIFTSIEVVFIMKFFFILSFFLKRLLITIAQSIIFFCNFVKKIDQNFDKNSDEIQDFMAFCKQNMLPQEIIVLTENLDHFVWVVDFFSKAKEAKHENNMLKKGIFIFKKINLYEGLEIVYDKLISNYKKNASDVKSIEEAMNHCREILQIQLDYRNEMLDKKDRQSIADDDLQKISNKICQYINNILNLIAKLLSFIKQQQDSKQEFDEKKLEEYNNVYQEIIKISKELNFKDFLKVKLLLKNARILYKRAVINNTGLFKNSAKKLDHAWRLLDEIKQNDKDDNFQIKNITVLRQKVLFHKGVASQHYGNDSEALKFLVSSLDYGNYYSNRLRVKTLNFMASILRNPAYRKKKEILKDLSAFIRKDKRNFYILVDCSRQIQDNKNKVATIIYKIYNEYMGDKDKITIIKYGDKVENILDLYEKEVHKKKYEFTIESIEKELFQTTSSSRCLYKAFQQCIEQAKQKEEKAISKYIIIFAFGENTTRKEVNYEKNEHKLAVNMSNSMNSNLDDDNYSSGNNEENSNVSMSVISMKDKINRPEGDEDFDSIQKELTDGFFHLLLIKQNIKNHGSQKSKIIQLCEKSRRHYIIDLETKPFITDIIKDVAGFLQ
ncbi:hypothetical protein ABPG72_018650 [Tetrahymena utriculariae]